MEKFPHHRAFINILLLLILGLASGLVSELWSWSFFDPGILFGTVLAVFLIWRMHVRSVWPLVLFIGLSEISFIIAGSVVGFLLFGGIDNPSFASGPVPGFAYTLGGFLGGFALCVFFLLIFTQLRSSRFYWAFLVGVCGAIASAIGLYLSTLHLLVGPIVLWQVVTSICLGLLFQSKDMTFKSGIKIGNAVAVSGSSLEPR